MSFKRSSPLQEFGPVNDDGHERMHMGQPDSRQSSEDDGPIMTRRKTREARREHHHTVSTGKSRKKQAGPKVWAAKPIMKNDMDAKMEIIREIEGLWGKGFIRTYIPKCHRPLVKRGKGGKRSTYRDDETDPRNWLPSVLKAILELARLTNNKEWLKKAMYEVVCHRIKHTGNRKPQLVTTDFDVIDDMLQKKWNIAYSFSIRYKYLLVKRKDGGETDENVDHILQAGSDCDESSQEDNGEDDMKDNDDNPDDQDQDHDGISGRYLRSNGYIKPPNYISPTPTLQHSKLHKDALVKKFQLKQSPPPHQFGMYGYNTQISHYGPQFDHWGRTIPMPIHGHGGLGGYSNIYNAYNGSYGRYSSPHVKDARQASQQHLPRVMLQYPYTHHATTPPPSMPESESSAHINPYRRGYGSPFAQGMNPYNSNRIKIKRESPEQFDSPSNDLGEEDQYDDADNDDIDAQIAAAKIELHIARLQAKKARRK